MRFSRIYMHIGNVKHLRNGKRAPLHAYGVASISIRSHQNYIFISYRRTCNKTVIDKFIVFYITFHSLPLSFSLNDWQYFVSCIYAKISRNVVKDQRISSMNSRKRMNTRGGGDRSLRDVTAINSAFKLPFLALGRQ